MNTLLQDLKFSLRLLAKTPGFTLTAIAVLALGIGLNSMALARWRKWSS